MRKTLLLLVIFLISLFPALAGGEKSEVNERKKIINALQIPMKISYLDWMFLQWEIFMIKNPDVFKSFREEGCYFAAMRLDKENSAIRVPIICTEKILKNLPSKRLDIIGEGALGYLRIFSDIMLGVWRTEGEENRSEKALNKLKRLLRFDARVTILDQEGNLVELMEIGSYEFGEKRLHKKEK